MSSDQTSILAFTPIQRRRAEALRLAKSLCPNTTHTQALGLAIWIITGRIPR